MKRIFLNFLIIIFFVIIEKQLCMVCYADNEYTRETEYVFFGKYPQTELSDTEITDEIINILYDENGQGTQDGVQYMRKDGEDGEYHYFIYEPVRWRVMKREGTMLYLISDEVIELGEFYSGETWENSKLRKWLNNDFLNNLLSKEEQSCLVSVDKDYVWMLTESEWYSNEYGFSEYCKISMNDTRKFFVTDYAEFNGRYWIYADRICVLLKENNQKFGYLRIDGMTSTFDNTDDTGIYGLCPVICVDENAVEHCTIDTNNDNDNKKNKYFGYYPHTEVLGNNLSDVIINAKYDANGDAVVDGIKYRRVSEADYYDKSDNTDFFYFKWNQGGDDNGYHYFKYEPIKWNVLEENDEDILIISCDIIDTKPYDTSRKEKYLYENSTLRKYILSDKFLNQIFTKEQQQILIGENIKDGVELTDKVWIPSMADMLNSDYGYDTEYFGDDILRMAMPTDFAHAMGAEVNSVGAGWWLRDILWDLNANTVNYYGNVHPEQGATVSSTQIGIRLMARVEKNSPYIFDAYETAEQYYENNNMNYYENDEKNGGSKLKHYTHNLFMLANNNEMNNLHVIIYYGIIIILFLIMIFILHKWFHKDYLVLVIKNIKNFAEKKTYYFVMIVIGQIVSFVILLMSYGILQNNLATKDEIRVSDTMYRIEFQEGGQKIKEFKSKLSEMIEYMGEDFDSCNIFIKYNDESMITHMANPNYYETEYEGMFEYEQLIGNECVARVSKMLNNYQLGDEMEIGGVNYIIVGKYNCDIPQVPINTINDEAIVTSADVNLYGIPVINDSKRYTKKLEELFGDNVLLNKPESIDLLSIQKKNYIILGTILITILIIMNAVLCYIYILNSRKKWMAVIEICGAEKRQCIIIYFLEILIINVTCSFVGVCIFTLVVYGKMISTNYLYKDIYSLHVYVYVIALYIVIAAILSLYHIVKFVNKSVLSGYKNL